MATSSWFFGRWCIGLSCSICRLRALRRETLRRLLLVGVRELGEKETEVSMECIGRRDKWGASDTLMRGLVSEDSSHTKTVFHRDSVLSGTERT